MSQFRKTGNRYISQWNGNDNNDGLTPLTPWRTANTNTNVTATYILGAGTYIKTDFSGVSTIARTFIGDGKVILNFQNVTFFGNGIGLADLHVRNAGGFSQGMTSENVIFEDSQITSRSTLRNCVIAKNVTYRSTGYNGTIQNNLFVSSHEIIPPFTTTYNAGNFSFNFFSKTHVLRMNPLNGSFIGYQNNMINGLIAVPSIDNILRECKKNIDGSARIDSNSNIPDIGDIIPDFYALGNFSGDPKFIDVISKTVYPESDLLKKSNQFGYIGGVKVGQYINFLNNDFQITYQNMDISNPNILRIADGFDFGKIRITGKISDTLISSQQIDIRIPFFFDADQPAGTGLNNNVPDAFNGLRGIDVLGDLPARLRFEIRTSQMTNVQRSNNDDWDNDITGVPGRWYLMEYGQPMLHHVLEGVAYGNADKFAINAPVKVPFNYRSIDMEITLSNTRSQV